MTRFQIIRFWVVTILAIILGITEGWETGLGLVVGVCLVLGVWVVICATVDALLKPLEARTEVHRVEPMYLHPYVHPDPTRPDDDEHPVIDLTEYRRLQRGE